MRVNHSPSLLLACTAAVLLAACGGPSDGDALGRAAKLMDKGDFSGATFELKTALQQSPNLGEARFRLGVVLLELGDPKSALVELQKARDLGYAEDELAPKVARAWLATGKNKEVVQTYTGVRVSPARNQAELLTALALAHGALGQRAPADAAIDEALKTDPKLPLALISKARFVAAAGKVDEALGLVEQAMVPGALNGDALMLKGMFLRYAKRDDAGAIKALEQAAKDTRVALGARSTLTTIFIQQNRLQDARAQLAALAKTHPKHPQALFLDAVVAYAARDFARSSAICEQLLRGLSNNTQVLVLAGASDLQRGALVAAESKLGKVVQTVEGAVGARKLLAETYLRMGQTDKVQQTLKPLLEQPSPEADTLNLSAQSHLMAGEFRQAEAQFAAAAKLKPDDVRVRTSLALIDLAKGNAPSALDTLQALAAKDPGDTADLALINAQLRRRDFDAALTAIAGLEKKQPERAAAPHLRGIVLLRKGDRAGARAAFEAALGKAPGHFASTHALATLDEQEQQPAAAIKRLEAVVKANPNNIAARMALLDVMLRAKAAPADILAGIDAAIQAGPAEAAPRVAKIVQLSRMNDAKGAAMAAQQAMSALPGDRHVLDAAGVAFIAAGDEQQAISAFNKLTSLMPNSAQPYLRLADVHARKGRTAGVASSLSRATDVEPLSAELHRRLLIQGRQTRDYKAAKALAADLQKRYARRPEGYLLDGEILAVQGQWPAAAAAYQAGLKAAPGTELAMRATRALERAGNRQAADALAGDWASRHPADGEFQAFLGDRARAAGDHARAERHYLDALRIDPEQAAVMNNLAWVQARLKKDSALGYAEKAVQMRPQQAEFMDTLAGVLADRGQLDKAIEWQRKALAIRPDDPELKLALARVLVQAGQKAEANKLLGELAKLGGTFKAQAEVQALSKRAD